MNSELIEILNIIPYRLEESLQNSSESYLSFQPGNDARSPSEILSHLVDVSNYGLSILNVPKPIDSEKSVLKQINGNLVVMKSYLSHNKVDMDTTKKLINGPLSDTLTHIGQLAFLRRLEGSPIEWENYTNADT